MAEKLFWEMRDRLASLAELDRREVFYVVRKKKGMSHGVVRCVAKRKLPKNVFWTKRSA